MSENKDLETPTTKEPFSIAPHIKQVTEHMTKNGHIYSSLHLVLFIVAMYLMFKCNDGKFNFGSFMFACCCPYLYIPYAVATGCGTK